MNQEASSVHVGGETVGPAVGLAAVGLTAVGSAVGEAVGVSKRQAQQADAATLPSTFFIRQ